MLRETAKEVELELALLHRLLDSNRQLLDHVVGDDPDGTELLAVSALVHSFYTGIENIFKRIAVDIDGGMPAGQKSHSQLLVQMQTATDKRPAVLDEQMRLKLGEYMDFRHVFRHAYSFELKWPKMRGLVVDLRQVFEELESRLRCFFAETDN